MDFQFVHRAEPYAEDDRCAAEAIDRSGLGVCVDHNTVFRCICPHDHPATEDGLDCQP